MAASIPTLPKREEVKDDLVACSICSELYDNGDHQAKYLPCLHTFCKSCLQTCIGENSQFNCPKCQYVVNLNGDTVDSLPDNFIVVSLEREHGFSHLAESCGSCEDEKSQVVNFCHECGSYLCQICTDQHKRMRPLRNHKLSTLDEVQEKKRDMIVKEEQFCKKHPEQRQMVYCKDSGCQVPLCATCSSEDHHQNHEIVDLEKVAAEVVAEIQGASKKLDHKKEDFVRKHEVVQAMQKILMANFDQKVKDMQESQQNLIDLIQSQFDKMHAHINNLYQTEMNRLSAIIESVDLVAAHMTTANDFAKRACASNQSVQMLSSCKQLKNRLCELQKCKLPDTSSDQKNDFAFTVKHHVAVKQIQESMQQVFNVDWLTDKLNEQKIDPYHCTIEITHGKHYKPDAECLCRYYCHARYYAKVQTFDSNDQPMATGGAKVEAKQYKTSYNVSDSGRGTYSFVYPIDSGFLPEVTINNKANLEVQKMILGSTFRW